MALEQGEPGQGHAAVWIELHDPAHETPTLEQGEGGRQLGGQERRPDVAGVEGQRLMSLAARLVNAFGLEQAERELEVRLRRVGEVDAQTAGLLHGAVELPHRAQQSGPLQAARVVGITGLVRGVVGILRHASGSGARHRSLRAAM